MTYQRANTDWLADCGYGIGVHWVVETMPLAGPPRPYSEAVERFDLDRFVAAIEESGADYLIFTGPHFHHHWPAPHAALDALLPGRTCERDLIGEIADRLHALGKRFILYYNHCCNRAYDLDWERASGYHDADRSRFADALCAVVREPAERYGERVDAWWFDSAWAIDARGDYHPRGTMVAVRFTAPDDYRFPFERVTEAAKTGHPERLVAWNPSVNKTFLFTEHQDYWAGELSDLSRPPTGRTTDTGLQWHGWTILDNRNSWVRMISGDPFCEPIYSDTEVLEFVTQCNTHRATMAFNVEITQEGIVSPHAVAALRRLGEGLGESS